LPQRASTLAPFRNPQFRILWSATLASNLGGLVQGVGAGWMMTTLSQSHDLVALVQASTTLPIMIFSLAAGALADNYDRRRIMIVAQVFMMVTSFALAACGWMGWLTPWLLLTFTFLIGCGTALYNPSWQASMGDIVTREDLPGAVTLNGMGFNLMRSVGPAVGGIIVSLAGAAAAFIVNAFSYLPLIAALTLWKPNRPERTLPREDFASAMSAGLRYVAMSPNLLRVIFRSFIYGFGAVSLLALMPVVASDLLQGNALVFGILLGCFGLGAIGGAFVNARIREVLSNEWIVRYSFIGYGLSCILLAQSEYVWLSLLLLLPAGMCWVLALSLFNVTVQLSTPRWVVGRALALYQTATFGGMAAGSWVWGVLSDEVDPRFALSCAGILLFVGALVGLRYTLPAFGSLNLDPFNHFNEPALRLDLKPRSGPIMVMIDYNIAQKDIPAFLAAMTDRRRIRIRDGARQWALLRDLENPETWTESYHVPTWLEYVRHNQRRTYEDQKVWETLRNLHQGTDAPRVHRMIERQTVPPTENIPIKQNPVVP